MTDNELLYEKLISQVELPAEMAVPGRDEFFDFVSTALEGMEVIRSGESGFMYYELLKGNGRLRCRVPEYGYNADSEKTAVRLFQLLADRIADDIGAGVPCDFSASLYSGDTECINAFHMMQFGTMLEAGIKKLTGPTADNANDGIMLKSLAKAELKARWNDVWGMTAQIVRHLQKSPVFYPGHEFTEDVYRDFFMSPDTEVICAFRGGTPVGMIEWNRDENRLLCPKDGSVNVGEIYVIPELRRTGLAERLLGFAEGRAYEAGAGYMWLEHGTANPNARGFWNKYFKTYKYELVRTINSMRFD